MSQEIPAISKEVEELTSSYPYAKNFFATAPAHIRGMMAMILTKMDIEQTLTLLDIPPKERDQMRVVVAGIKTVATISCKQDAERISDIIEARKSCNN